jgi:4-hydroxy-2-oxoheptanedioate aldolase
MGFDFVVIDAQHGLISEDACLAHLRAIGLGAAKPVVRCASAEPAHIGRMLDYGAQTLIVPMIETVQEVRELVRATRYAPEGKRSFGPTRVSLQYKDYYREGARAARLFPMIETRAALDEVEEIAAMDGVAGLFVGPADLSLSLGLNPARDNPEPVFAAAIDRILAACRKHAKVAGIQADRSVAEKRIRQGFSFLTVCLDSSDLKAHFAESLRMARAFTP